MILCLLGIDGLGGGGLTFWGFFREGEKRSKKGAMHDAINQWHFPNTEINSIDYNRCNIGFKNLNRLPNFIAL